MALTADRLLRALDPLAFPSRQRLLAATARRLVGSAELDELLAELSGGDDYAQQVALVVAGVARHEASIRRALGGDAPRIVAGALRLAVKFGFATDQLVAMVPSLPTALRQELYQACRRAGARSLAMELLTPVRARWGDGEAAGLLVLCSAETVDALLPELEYAIANWPALARQHPDSVLDYIEAQLAVRPTSVWRILWRQVGPGLVPLAQSRPQRVLELLELTLPHLPLPPELASRMGALVRHDRDRVLRLLLDPARRGTLPFDRPFLRACLDADDDDLVRLGRALGAGQMVRFLHAIPPRRRGAVYAGLVAGRSLPGFGLPIEALDELVVGDRAAEAVRLLGLPQVADNPSLRLAISARLPWADALPVLTEAIRRPLATERAEAYPFYVQCAAATRDPAIVADMLTGLGRVARDQDPVRSVALSALADLPSWVLRHCDTGALLALMTESVQRRDASWATTRAVGVLSLALLREGLLAGDEGLAFAGLSGVELLGEQGSVRLDGLSFGLPHGAENGVFAVLEARLRAEAKRGRYDLTLSLARGLGRRAWQLEGLQDLIDQARTAKKDHVVTEAVSLWLEPWATRDARVETVLRDDRSTITIHAVEHAVSLRRTDLLDLVIGKRIEGRFLKKGPRYTPHFSGCSRWLPRQQRAYAAQLVKIATDRDAAAHESLSAIARLGRVPGSLELLRPFVDSHSIQVQEAALAALANTDRPAAVLGDLLAFADTDRASIALYAATRCVRFATPDQLVAALVPVLQVRKVTSRKEAVRLLVVHRAPGSAAMLREVWSTPDQHRDVRRAVVSAARLVLDEPVTWDVLAEAATAKDIASAVLENAPSSMADRFRPAYADLVLTVSSSDDADLARLGLTALPEWATWGGRSALAMTSDRVADLTVTSTWRQALSAMLALSGVFQDGTAVYDVAARLVDQVGRPFEHRDQPAARRLTVLVDMVAGEAAKAPWWTGDAQRLVDLVVDVVPRPAVKLAASCVSWKAEEDEILRGLRRVTHLRGLMVTQVAARPALSASLTALVGRLDGATLLRLAATLAEGDAAEQLVALAMADVVGPATGWAGPWIDLVAGLRTSAHLDVRALAIDTFTMTE